MNRQSKGSGINCWHLGILRWDNQARQERQHPVGFAGVGVICAAKTWGKARRSAVIDNSYNVSDQQKGPALWHILQAYRYEPSQRGRALILLGMHMTQPATLYWSKIGALFGITTKCCIWLNEVHTQINSWHEKGCSQTFTYFVSLSETWFWIFTHPCCSRLESFGAPTSPLALLDHQRGRSQTFTYFNWESKGSGINYWHEKGWGHTFTYFASLSESWFWIFNHPFRSRIKVWGVSNCLDISARVMSHERGRSRAS
jgi:hypothetical protein